MYPIQTAVDSAIAGDSLVFSPHKFTDRRVVINKNLVLKGTQTPTDSTIITQAGVTKSIFYIENPSLTAAPITILFKDVIIQDAVLTCTSAGYSGYDPKLDSLYGIAIKAFENTDLTISGNSIFRNCRMFTSCIISTYDPLDTTMYGGVIYSKGKLTINGNSKFLYNITLRKQGGAITSLKELLIEGNVLIDSNYSANGGAIAAQGAVLIRGNVTISNCYSGMGGGIFVKYCDLNLSDSVKIIGNTAKFYGAGIYAEQSNTSLKNKTIIWGNFGTGIVSISSNLSIHDSTVIAFNLGNENSAAGIYNKGGSIDIRGGQIVGNYYNYDSVGGKGMAIYNDTISGSAAPIVKVANARIFNPTQLFKRTNEIFNADGVKFSSDSTWWGESDTTGLIQNAGSATTSLGSWIVADWSINKAAPIGYATTFPIEAYFKLNSGAAIPAKMFWMLKGLYACDHGTFAPDTADMMGTNIISTDYTSSDTTRLVNIIATVDADTFRHSQVITGLSIDNLQSGEKSYFEIYPNPATTFVNIMAEHAHQATTVKVYDLMGKIMLRKICYLKTMRNKFRQTSLQDCTSLNLQGTDSVLKNL